VDSAIFSLHVFLGELVMKSFFIARQFHWPLRTGSSVHAGNIMKSMAKLGHDITLITEVPIEESAAKLWLKGVSIRTLSDSNSSPGLGARFSYLQRRGSRYAGISEAWVDRVTEMVLQEEPQAVVVIGLPGLPLLAKLPESISRCWYVADDPQLAMWCGSEPLRLRAFFSQLAYQRIFRRSVDSVWVVSERDRKWSRFFGGWRSVKTVPNGVDTDFFSSMSQLPRAPASPMAGTCKSDGQQVDYGNKLCGFWGNLAFPPNVDALTFFLKGPWPTVHTLEPSAQLVVAGANASSELIALMEQTPGVRFLGEVDSIAEAFESVPIAVFPFRTGAGIKNKVLEAAAMGKTLLISPTATNGLCGAFNAALQVVTSDSQWASALDHLFKNPEAWERSGLAAQRWVLENHTWGKSAQIALQTMEIKQN
jgi:glycosyltransferase involved in cell wall biosynthesis